MTLPVVVLFPGQDLPFPARVQGISWKIFLNALFRYWYDGRLPVAGEIPDPERNYLDQVIATEIIKIPYQAMWNGTRLKLGINYYEFYQHWASMPVRQLKHIFFRPGEIHLSV